MTRNEVLAQIYRMAEKLSKEWNYEEDDKMWELCSDWNREHEDEEIFMMQDEEENRFYVEDDYFLYPER